MADKVKNSNASYEPVKINKPMLSPGVHLGFLVFGVFVSLGLFLGVQAFTETILSNDYKRVSVETSEMIAREFSELEYSIRTVSTLLALSDEGDSDKIIKKLNNVESSLEPFDTLLWLHKDQGAWTLLPLYEDLFQSDNSQDYSNVLKDPAIQKAIRSALRKPDQLYMVTDIKGYDDEKNPSFSFVKATHNSAGNDSVLLAFTSLNHAFEARRLNINALVSSLSIREISENKILYDFKREKNLARADYDMRQSFDLEVGGQTIEIDSQFFKQGNMLLLEVLPFFVLAFCLILTVTITLYLRTNHKQAVKFSQISKHLSDKNAALEDEIHKRELLDQTARRVDRENRVIIDSVSDIIFEADIDGKILFLNAQWLKITGFETEQSLGLELFKILHPQDQHDVRDEFQALVHGRVKSFRKFTRLRTSDGTFRAAELSVSMINQDDEREKRLVGTFTDVEERRRAERALSEAERKYRNIVQNAAGGIFQITPEGLYLSANPAMADILGYESPEQVLREIKNAHQDIYVDSNARYAFIRDLQKSEIATNHEVQVMRRDGTEIWVNENIHTVRDETGNILYFEGSMEDISARKMNAMALHKAKVHSDLANRAKSEFLTNMSHELRTPLNSIIGFSEMIKSEVLGKLEQEAYLEYAKDINDSGKSLLNIINEILDISKIEAGERHLNESQIRVERIAGACLDLLSAKIEAGKIIVTNNLAGMPEVIGEDLSIKQVLMNLLSNAVKFTPKGGRVTLSYELARNGALHISVTDTGIGLDKTEIKKALSPFGQIDNELAREGTGTGLGLTLVDALLKLHGGELNLVSQKGIGTTATIILPKDRVVVKKTQPSDIAEKNKTV